MTCPSVGDALVGLAEYVVFVWTAMYVCAGERTSGLIGTQNLVSGALTQRIHSISSDIF